MKTTIKNIVAIAAAAVLATGMLAGCSNAATAGDVPAGVQENTEQFGPWVPDGVTLQASATPEEAVDGDAVVEVLDEAGNTVQMTAAEAKASGRQVVSGGASAPAASSQGGSAPSSSTSTPAASAAPVHEHNWQWVVDKAAWDETAYKTVSCAICNGCGADVTSDPWGHCGQDRTSPCQGFHSSTKQVPAGTIHHDAVGHYACSCGATK